MNQILYHGRPNFKLQRQHEHVRKRPARRRCPLGVVL